MSETRQPVSGSSGRLDDMSTTLDDLAIGFVDTQVGRLSVGVTAAGVAAVGWGEPAGVTRHLKIPVTTDSTRTDPVIDQLEEYFAGTRTRFDLPLDWRATTNVQHAVLKTLLDTVPAGESITYGALAERSGTGVPARGIGAIMGSNPIPIIVACHRVVASDGLGGYSGGNGRNGLDVKRWLLMFEGALPATLGWNQEVGVPA
jgi:methylated-DNA-[protein]-cysteine S-methyltransferase